MFVYQLGKLYFQEDDKLIGVEIHSDIILKIQGIEADLDKNYERLSLMEVKARFNGEYDFPIEIKVEEPIVEENVGEKVEPVKEVVKDEPSVNSKRPPRKSTSK